MTTSGKSSANRQPMAFSRMHDKTNIVEREYREGANFANFRRYSLHSTIGVTPALALICLANHASVRVERNLDFEKAVTDNLPGLA